ncbi:MAG: hypothetical protein V9G14_17880 [Cypionkella sp.]
MTKALALPFLLLTTPALAGSFTPPEGCTTFLTVQSRGCYVANYYRCEADTPGDQWRADFDQQGPFYLSRIDSETQWVESYESNPTVRQTLDPDPADPASFTTLLQTGTDTFDFALTKDNGEHTTVKGYDKLTGKTMMIDGIMLEQTEFDYTETDAAGNVLRQSSGNEYIKRDWRNFFSGTSQWMQPDGTSLPLDGTPVQFILPGEKGFAATQPLFQCDAVMSSADPNTHRSFIQPVIFNR